MLYMGFAQTDITPDRPMVTVGFGLSGLSEGVLSPLFAQVSVWQGDGDPCAVIAIDHIGYGMAHANALRDRVGRALGVSRDRVMLCFSHTHSAPNDSVEEAYFETCALRIVRAAERAAGDMTRVNAAWGNGYAEIGMGRRFCERDMDTRMGILKVTDAGTGRLKLILLRLTAHANVLKADNHLISPDYFGTARDALIKRFGCPAMLTQGASGDIAPYFFRAAPGAAVPDYYGRVASLTALDDMAARIVKGVEDELDAILSTGGGDVSMRCVSVALYADVPTMERAREIADEAAREVGENGDAWLAEVKRLRDAGIFRQTQCSEIQYFSVAGGCLCGVADEIMSGFALRAQARTGSAHFYLGGYTNGCGGYFPTEEEYDKGGYEVHWSLLSYFMYFERVAALNRESAAQLIDAVVAGAANRQKA